MTKAARIRDLLAGGMANAEIAALVGCGDYYVRTVKQRLGGQRACDRAWKAKNPEKHRKWISEAQRRRRAATKAQRP